MRTPRRHGVRHVGRGRRAGSCVVWGPRAWQGVPSTERLMKAVLLATPAMPFAMVKAADVQRDGAMDPLQHGQVRQSAP